MVKYANSSGRPSVGRPALQNQILPRDLNIYEGAHTEKRPYELDASLQL